MGSHNAVDSIEIANVNDAYRRLCDDARFEDGHSGYSGTIATTNGVYVHESTPLHPDTADAVAWEISDQQQKRDAAAAVAYADASLFKSRQVKVASVTLKPGVDPYLTHSQVEAILRKRGLLRPGERVGKPKVTVKKPAASKIQTHNIPAAERKRLFMAVNKSNASQVFAVKETKKEAVEAAKAKLIERGQWGEGGMEIAVLQTSTLAVLTGPPAEEGKTISIETAVHSPKAAWKPTSVKGWAFAYRAAS